MTAPLLSNPPTGVSEPTQARRHAKLKALFIAEQLVFVGGRNTANSIATARSGGFAGDIVLINPNGAEIAGAHTLPRLSSLAESPKVTFISVPREATVEVVRELANMDAGTAICYAAGFAELNPSGATLQEELVAAAGSLALLGPNCNGIVNNITGGSLWPTPGAGRVRVKKGPVLIAQSGGLSVHFLMNQRSVDFAYAITVGNQAVLGVEDCIAALADDPNVTSFAVYLEGLRDVPAFVAAAEAADAHGKPIIILKSGRSGAGSRITLSHTSSISGTQEIYDALFERVGAISVSSATEFLETIKIFDVSGPPSGRRVAFFTCSGGSSSLAADLADDLGLEMPDFDTAAKEDLAARLPYFATVTNPLDYNTALWGKEDELTGIFSTAMAAEMDAGVLLIDYTPPLFGDCEAERANTRALIRASQATGVPAYVCSILPDLLPEEERSGLAQAGVAPLQGLTDGLHAIAHAANFAVSRDERRGETAALASVPAIRADLTVQSLDEVASKTLFVTAGLTIPRGELCSTEMVAAAACRIGFPVVLKAVGATLAHKTEAGAVRLGLGDREAVIRAAAEIREIAGQAEGSVPDQYLVEEMIPDAIAELMLGIVRHEGFGLALVIASGGTQVELLRDSVTLLLPTSRVLVSRALARLRSFPLLEGFRGGPPGDIDAVVEAALALAAFAQAERDYIIELEVNPLMVRPKGLGVVAVDALVRLAQASQKDF